MVKSVSMEQHPVPQHIASFQFKLFGNLTVRQFITLLGPMIVAGIIFFSEFEPVIIKYFLSGIIGLGGFIVAVVPVGGRPFDKWIVAFVKAIFAPTQRIWIKEKQIPEFLSIVTSPVRVDEKIPEEVTAKGKERLIAYLRSLPKDNQSPLDTREQVALSRLNFDVEVQSNPQVPPPIIWPSEFETKDKDRSVQFGANIESMQGYVPTQELGIKKFMENKSEITQKKVQEIPSKPVQLPVQQVQIHPSVKHFSVHGLEDRLKVSSIANKVQKSKARPAVSEMHILKTPKLRAHLASDGNFSVDNIISLVEPDNHVRFVRGVGKTRVRKLHFAPPINFDLSKLPIRGERRFEISDELKKRFNFPDESPEVILPNEKSVVDNKTTFDTSSIVKPVNQILPKVENRVADVSPKEDVVQQVTKQKTVDSQPASQFAVTNVKKHQEAQQVSAGPQIIPLTNVPNVLSGLVTDKNGAPIVGAVLVVRDANGIPVRALKTNKLGQFLSATPLSNGSYTVEVESDVASFKAASFNLSGNVLPPLGLKGEEKGAVS